MSINRIAEEIKSYPENIVLIYAFNGTGKTWLSKEFHNISKRGDDYSGVFYNAYSEDLFIWNNKLFQLEILNSRLSKLHQYFGDESAIKDKLKYLRILCATPVTLFQMNEKKILQALITVSQDFVLKLKIRIWLTKQKLNLQASLVSLDQARTAYR